jgi:hypothetical protein
VREKERERERKREKERERKRKKESRIKGAKGKLQNEKSERREEGRSEDTIGRKMARFGRNVMVWRGRSKKMELVGRAKNGEPTVES